jgi:predicted nucleotidyltransferase
MIDIVKNKQRSIEEICQKYLVKSLFLFGSAAKGNFSNESDLDFVVVFKEEVSPVDFADYFFGLQEDLKQLLNKEIDLLSKRAIRNSIIISEIEKTKVPVYAAL